MNEETLNPAKWPAWVTALDGTKKIVKNPFEHERETGIRVDGDGAPLDVEEDSEEPQAEFAEDAPKKRGRKPKEAIQSGQATAGW